LLQEVTRSLDQPMAEAPARGGAPRRKGFGPAEEALQSLERVSSCASLGAGLSPMAEATAKAPVTSGQNDVLGPGSAALSTAADRCTARCRSSGVARENQVDELLPN
jgi:hypothetical protein